MNPVWEAKSPKDPEQLAIIAAARSKIVARKVNVLYFLVLVLGFVTNSSI